MKVILKNASLEFQVGTPRVDVTITDFTPDGVNIIARNYIVVEDQTVRTDFTSVFIKLPDYTGVLNIEVTKPNGQQSNPIVGLFKEVPPADASSGTDLSSYVSNNETTPISNQWLTKEITSSETKWLQLSITQDGSPRTAESVRFYES